MGVHDGHRERMRERYRRDGADTLAPHELLELLLYYASPRGDMNPVAHRLIQRFGSLDGVFSAAPEELAEVEGVGESMALLISLLPQIARRCSIQRAGADDAIDSSEKAGNYLLPYFRTERSEVVYVLCLDSKRKVLSCRLVIRGGISSATVDARKIVEAALRASASGVILAHNHTSGVALPSEADEKATRHLAAVLAAVDVALLDHIIVADEDFISMADNGFFR